jgi:hypothetical protein
MRLEKHVTINIIKLFPTTRAQNGKSKELIIRRNIMKRAQREATRLKGVHYEIWKEKNGKIMV